MLLLFLALVPCGFAAMCNNAPWSDNDRNGIVNAHNQLRSKIARGVYVAKGQKKPPAKDMLKMVYDCGLEASAQKWANTCPTGHSPQKCYLNDNGECMYSTWSGGNINITGKGIAASKLWEKEFQDYGWSTNLFSSEVRKSIGHATQMAWAATSKIGCGVKQCPSKRAGYKNELIVVCQYNPMGNVRTWMVYVEGATCSACPKGTTCEKSTGLCI